MSNYQKFLQQLQPLAFTGPKPPKNYNMHLIKAPFAVAEPPNKMIARKSNRYDSLYSSDKIPIPSVLHRHLLTPISPLVQETAIGKVVGFRIEVKGRVGSRSMRRSVNYGVLDSGKIGPLTGTLVDFGKSSFVTKRGESGVKVWIAYGNK